MYLLSAEKTHKVVLEGDEETGLAGVALTSGASAELVVDAAGFVALGADDVKTAGGADFLRLGGDFILILLVEVAEKLSCGKNILRAGLEIGGGGGYHLIVVAELSHLRLGEEFGVAAEHNIGASSRHVGGDGDGAGGASLGDDFSLFVVVLRVEHVVGNAALFEHRAQNLGFFNGNGADEDGLTFGVRLGNILDYGVKFSFLGFVNNVRLVVTDDGLVGGNFDYVETVNLTELVGFGHSRTGHTGELFIHTEVVLEGDGGKGFALPCDGDALFRLDCLMKSLVVAASDHKTSGELVNYDYLSVLDDVVNVALHYAVGFNRLVDMVEKGHIFRVVEVLDVEVFLRLFNAPGSDGGGVRLFVDDVVGGYVVNLLLFVALLDADGGEGAGEAVRLLVKVGGFVAATGNDKRSSRLVYENGVHLIDDCEGKAPLDAVFFIGDHVVAKIVEAELVVGAVGDVAGVGGSSVVVFNAVDNETDGKSHIGENLAHPLGVALREVVVDGDDMNALAGETVEICGKGLNKGFALAGFHLGDAPLVKNDAADYLDRIGAHFKHPVAGFAAGGESLGKNIVKGLALGETLAEERRLSFELLLAHGAVFVLKRKNFLHDRVDSLKLFL